jgi:hypothetical protein
MTADDCLGFLCFSPLDADVPKFFGFSEFLAGLALMVLAWTIADVRYRFRVRVAPLPLQGITFAVVASVGVLTLLTDLWRAEQWWVPRGNLLTPASWQALLGGVYLLTFLTWAWFAFIRPPAFGRRNKMRFARALYTYILKGSPAELGVIADELTRSVRPLVRYATDRKHFKNFGIDQSGEDQRKLSKIEEVANDVLLLIADRRFCRVIVESSPVTALAVFQEMGEAKKYGIQVETFARNIMNEALANQNSFAFHEAEGYESGLIGYHKPLSQAMFANFSLVETVGTMLDPDIWGKSKWDADQWEAYCRLVLMTFHNYAETRSPWEHSYALYRAKGYIEHAASDVYKLNGLASVAWDNDSLARLRVVVKFIREAVEILDKKGVPDRLKLRMHKKHTREQTFYDHLANMIFETIFAASAVRSPSDECWWVQHNTVWHELFNFNSLDSDAGKIVKFKARRLLYDEIADMKRFPNFKGAKILGFCLNVMGLKLSTADHDRDSRALQKAVLSWTAKNYAWLHAYNPRVAETCLVDGLTYDAEKLRLVKTYPAEGLRREPHYVQLQIDAAPRTPERAEE